MVIFHSYVTVYQRVPQTSEILIYVHQDARYPQNLSKNNPHLNLVHPITVYGLIQMSPNTCAINVTIFEHRIFFDMFCMFQNGGVPQGKKQQFS